MFELEDFDLDDEVYISIIFSITKIILTNTVTQMVHHWVKCFVRLATRRYI